jgi:glycerol-3-phosphate dehydrogenase subunit C
MSMNDGRREGSLEAPTRHPLGWQSESFWDRDALHAELERVFDICHGCRRCFSLCNAFPTLFDMIDESETGEVDGVAAADYQQVIDHCYLCDMCYMSKCPYVPPHEWNVDFPHLMLRAKAVRFKEEGASFRDRLLSSTEAVGRLAGIPIVVDVVNAANRSAAGRVVLEKVLGVHRDARLPEYHADTLRKRVGGGAAETAVVTASEHTTGRVALFATCYCDRNEPEIGEDLLAVFRRNGIDVSLTPRERCCGMPKLELGDLDSVAQLMEENIPVLSALVDEGVDIVAAVPSCVLMFKQELPLMFPDDERVRSVAAAIFDPFEYLWLRHKAGLLDLEFSQPLGKVSYHVACHLRVQNLGLKTRDVLSLIPDTEIEPIERCSGHDGTYAVKREFHEVSMKIARPVVNRVRAAEPAHYTSDCPMAGHQIANGLADGSEPTHPMTLLRRAYGL